MEYDIPTFQELLRVAPTATLVILIAAIGWYVGYKSRDETIKTLREWLDSIRRK